MLTPTEFNIGFKNKTYNEHEYTYLGIEVANAEKPEEVYDIVLDAGHGGKDKGENGGEQAMDKDHRQFACCVCL